MLCFLTDLPFLNNEPVESLSLKNILQQRKRWNGYFPKVILTIDLRPPLFFIYMQYGPNITCEKQKWPFSVTPAWLESAPSIFMNTETRKTQSQKAKFILQISLRPSTKFTSVRSIHCM